MALSIFLRNSVCRTGSILRQQMMMASKHNMTQRPVVSVLPLKTLALKEANTGLILSRSFRTSAVRMSDEKPHDHARLWVIEKATSALLVPLVPIGLLMPNKIVDCALAVLICAHSFWGMEAMVVEYVRVLLFGTFVPKIAMAIVYTFSAIIMGGLFYLIFNDIGLCRGFWKIWKNMKKSKSSGGGGAGHMHGPHDVPPCPPGK